MLRQTAWKVSCRLDGIKRIVHDWYYLNTAADGVEGLMRTGWFYKDNVWYFLNTVHDGYYGRAIAGHWQWIDGYCYLFDEDGRMYANCTTPDGYTVNADGQWTVDGVVQYVAGKGIITKVTDRVASGSKGTGSGGSGGGSSSGSSGGSSSGNGGSGGSAEDIQKSSSVTILYKDRETDEVLKELELSGNVGDTLEISHPDIEGYSVCNGQPVEAVLKESVQQIIVYYLKNSTSGKIVIQYVVNDTNEVLGEKEVCGEIGDIYIIQHPAIDGYKILDNQQEEAYYKSGEQVIQLSYRPIQDGEEPDQSIVVKDNVKAISPKNADEEEVAQQIRDKIFDFIIKEDGSIELAVEKDNMLLSYIEDGTYVINDVVYIDSCEAFPVEVVFTYLGHDDNYSGEYNDYDSSQFEVIHGQSALITDLVGPGTSVDFSQLGGGEAQLVGEWIPWWLVEDETESAQNEYAIMALSEDDYDFEHHETVNIPWSHDFDFPKVASDSDAYTGVNWTIDGKATPYFNLDLEIGGGIDVGWGTWIERVALYGKIGGELGINADFGFNGEISLEDIINAYKTRAAGTNTNLATWRSGYGSSERKNEIEKNVLGHNLTISGVDLSDSTILACVAYSILPTQQWEFRVENVLAMDGNNSVTAKLALVGFITLDSSLKGNGTVGVEAKVPFEAKIGGELDFVNDTTTDLSHFGGESENGALLMTGAFYANGGISDSKLGLGIAVGPTVWGIMPGELKVSAGIKPTLEVDARGPFEWQLIPLKWPEFSGEVTGKAQVNVYAQAAVIADLHAETEDGVTLGVSGELPYDWEKTLIGTKDFEDYSLTVNQDISVQAADSWGSNVSSEYMGYDSSSESVKSASCINGYSFQCPKYIVSKTEDGGTAYQNITEIVIDDIAANASQCRVLDISKASNVKKVTLGEDSAMIGFVGNGKAFPDQLKWYSDPEKTNEVTKCAAGQAIYSELYGDIEWVETELSINPSQKVYALDEFGRDISCEFTGYNAETGMAEVVETPEERYTFQCPQYIRYSSGGTCYKVTGIMLRTGNGIGCVEDLDLSKAPGIKEISVGSVRIVEMEVPENNEIEVMNLLVNCAFGDSVFEEIDYSQFPHLKELELYCARDYEGNIDLSTNSKLETVSITADRESTVDYIILPKKSNIAKLEITAPELKELVNLEKQHELTRLKLFSISDLQVVDISGCLKLEQSGYDDWKNSESDNSSRMETAKYIFIGNGKVMPYGTWYADEEKTEEVDYCDLGMTIYGSKYKKPETTLSVLMLYMDMESVKQEETEEEDIVTEIASDSNAYLPEEDFVIEDSEVAEDSEAGDVEEASDSNAIMV